MKERGFVLAIGRSGTAWLTQALREAGGVAARHETNEFWDSATRYGTVEVNSFLWANAPDIRKRYGEEFPIVHLVRDGRKVVRSILNRPRPGRTLEHCSRMWLERNATLFREVPEERRFRLEDLTSSFESFAELARIFRGRPDEDAWKRIRRQRVNVSRDEIWPDFDEWHKYERAVFWDVCGDLMAELGYPSTESKE